MRDFRIYMAVGGMPQAVEAYIKGKNFEQIVGNSISAKVSDGSKNDTTAQAMPPKMPKIPQTKRTTQVFDGLSVSRTISDFSLAINLILAHIELMLQERI